MNDVECFINCIIEAGLLYPIIILLSLALVFFVVYIFKRNHESLLAGQSSLTILISVNLLSMNCPMFSWFWYYLGIILFGFLFIGLIKYYLKLKLSNIVLSLPSYLSDIGNEFNVDILVLNSRRINAFTYKNKIYLSYGLLERLELGEVKSVIAHEVYHMKNSPNKILSFILALSSLTFHRLKDEHLADLYAVKTTGLDNLINALKKLHIKDAKKRILKLYSLDI